MTLRGWLARRRWRRATRRWADANVIGGWRAERQVRRFLKEQVALGREMARRREQAERGALYFRRWEARTDASLADALSDVLPRAPEETPRAHAARLRAALVSFRLRSDGSPVVRTNPRARARAPAPAQAPASDAAPPSQGPRAEERSEPLPPLSRRQMAALKRRIWGQSRRKPNASEILSERLRIARARP